MDEKGDKRNQFGVNRRAFIGALGATAVAGAFATTADAQSPPPVYDYLDSFGNIQPCSADTIAAGVLPPPLPTAVPAPSAGTQATHRRHWLFGPRSPGSKQHGGAAPRTSEACGSPTAPSAGFPKYNILMIIVDQMRAPRWLPSATPGVLGALSGQEAIDAILPNIASIRNQSFVFANYNVAATNCSPSRATLLTGLYAQQTCIFVSQDPPGKGEGGTTAYPPSLQPWKGGQGFPTIGDVLSQTQNLATGSPALGYDCVWIGKWHLSDNPLEALTSAYSCNPGGNGPSDYGFTDPYCIPTPPDGAAPYPAGPYPSSTGDANAGNSSYFLGNSVTGSPDAASPVDLPNYSNANPPSPPITPEPVLPPSGDLSNYDTLNDAAVTDAFHKWVTNVQPASKWFAAVSFINPHDITPFPYSFGLALTECPSPPQYPPPADFCYEGSSVSSSG
jgi:arylsulfatase A-like enzyme